MHVSNWQTLQQRQAPQKLEAFELHWAIYSSELSKSLNSNPYTLRSSEKNNGVRGWPFSTYSTRHNMRDLQWCGATEITSKTRSLIYHHQPHNYTLVHLLLPQQENHTHKWEVSQCYGETEITSETACIMTMLSHFFLLLAQLRFVIFHVHPILYSKILSSHPNLSPSLVPSKYLPQKTSTDNWGSS